jgi:hypothetical protein
MPTAARVEGPGDECRLHLLSHLLQRAVGERAADREWQLTPGVVVDNRELGGAVHVLGGQLLEMPVNEVLTRAPELLEVLRRT